MGDAAKRLAFYQNFWHWDWRTDENTALRQDGRSISKSKPRFAEESLSNGLRKPGKGWDHMGKCSPRRMWRSHTNIQTAQISRSYNSKLDCQRCWQAGRWQPYERHWKKREFIPEIPQDKSQFDGSAQADQLWFVCSTPQSSRQGI